jgi:F-type H+-transporting ATPase subunit b
MQIIPNIALISINETLLVQMVSFLIFLFVINRIMFRPLRATMQERERYIKRTQQDILDSKHQIEKIIQDTAAEESDVRRAANEVTVELEKAGNQKAGQIIDTARVEIAALNERAKQEIDRQIVEARKTITHEAETLALIVMQKILNRKVTSP